MEWIYNDGGRSNYFKGSAGDCACRAISIATKMDYKVVYDLINEKSKEYNKLKRKNRRGHSSARNGVHKELFKKIMLELGWKWVPLSKIGTGCTTHLKSNELPKDTIICNVSKHYVAVVDGVINDTYDCSRGGTRCVYGYYIKN